MSRYSDMADYEEKPSMGNIFNDIGEWVRTHNNPIDVRRNAIKCVASNAKNKNDCELLLEMLGLNAEDGKSDVHSGDSSITETSR